MDQQQIVAFIRQALECSVYAAPRQPGLTYQELMEAGARRSLKTGEIEDAIQLAQLIPNKERRLLPDQHVRQMWMMFGTPLPEPLGAIEAYDFVVTELKEAVREFGAQRAKLDRDVIVQRGGGTGLSRHDMEVAISFMVLAGQLIEKDGTILFLPGLGQYLLPSLQNHQRRIPKNATLTQAREETLALVKDIVERRSDGRQRSIEPLVAFADELDKLGHSHFRMWWQQTAGELLRCDPQTSPTAMSVLAAALVEGALAFTVKYARSLSLSVLGSNTLDGPPRNWKIEELIKGASHGTDAILDAATRQRVEALFVVRQRIHPGRMLSDFPQGAPDLKPEAARDSKATSELVARCVIEWLQLHPSK